MRVWGTGVQVKHLHRAPHPSPVPPQVAPDLAADVVFPQALIAWHWRGPSIPTSRCKMNVRNTIVAPFTKCFERVLDVVCSFLGISERAFF